MPQVHFQKGYQMKDLFKDKKNETSAKALNLATARGSVLNGVLFDAGVRSDTVLIAITGIHGNFYSNPFYYNVGYTLNSAGIDFVYAQTNDAFGQIRTMNVKSGKEEIIGSWNERFSYTDEDIEAYLDWAENAGYRHIYLAGHSLGANKVVYYLSRHKDKRVEHFFLLSPANLSYMMSGVTEQEKRTIRDQVERGDGEKMLPFEFMGWVPCIANTAYDWEFSGILDVAHVNPDGDFSVAEKVTHTGALLIGTYDNFCGGDPASYLEHLNDHMPTAKENKLIYIARTGHTYQQKEQEFADAILRTVQEWRNDAENKERTVPVNANSDSKCDRIRVSA